MKRPAFQFYPGDWLRSTDLRSCSVGARGLWIDMICLMHEGIPYGYLKAGDKVILPNNLARMVGATLKAVESWLIELKDSGVYSIDLDGCIFSRRMVKDEQTRIARASGGALGGNPMLMKKDNYKVVSKDNLNANLKPTPASASASARSTSSAANEKISLSADGVWDGISPAQLQVWRKAYPAVLLDSELNAAAAWITANPANKKSNYARFITNWLKRQQDKAPRSPQSSTRNADGSLKAIL